MKRLAIPEGRKNEIIREIRRSDESKLWTWNAQEEDSKTSRVWNKRSTHGREDVIVSFR